MRGVVGMKPDGNEAAHCFAGPLNLNRQTKQATTVMGSELPLDADEFKALDTPAAREGETVEFEQLYETVWNVGNGSNGRCTALTKPETGYCFQTKGESSVQKGRKTGGSEYV